MRSLLFASLLFTNLNIAFGQNPIAQKMEWLGKTKPTTNLFVHFDKNVYSNNETVYFTGYLIKPGLNAINSNHVMAVSLVRNVDSTIILSEKFLMQNGLSYGNINIPDSILTGNYRFIAFTERLTNGIPDVVYQQDVTIKTNIDPGFKASMKLIDPEKNENKLDKVLISVTSNESRFMKKPTSVNYKYGKVNVTTKTDLSGQLLINLQKQDNLIEPNIYIKLKNLKDSTYISMAVPQKRIKASVNFYPEGGNLVEGLYSNIGIEVKDQQKMPLNLRAFLYKNNHIVDTIETSNYGIGNFKLLIEKDAKYTVKLVHAGLVDTIYSLPKAVLSGLTLNLTKALVEDTLRVSLKTNDTRKLNIYIHNFTTPYLNFSFDMLANNRTIKIPLTDVPKGLTTITITDSLNRPLAERIFFTHYDNKEKLNMNIEKPIYNQREKVNLKLKLNDLVDSAIVSVAIVQNSRLELKKMNDIESYSYLKNELNNLPVNLSGIAYNDKDYLEQMLLTKGWRRYTWQNLETIKANDTIAKLDSLKLTGNVTKNKKELIKSVSIGTYGAKNLSFINSDNKGIFSIEDENLIIEDNKKLYLFLAVKDIAENLITINNPYLAIVKNILKTLPIDSLVLPSTLLNNGDMVLKNNEKIIRLKEVVIGSKEAPFAWGANKCGDYVCSYKILNCPNHVTSGGNTPPVKGKQYLTRYGLKIYEGCDDTAKKGFYQIDGIHYQKEFYLNDYKDPQEPAFFSTIYWNYGLILNGNKAAELEFHTSDITGKFRIVVQGITNNDVIYGEHFFEVKPKIIP